MSKRRRFSAEFKPTVAFEALRGELTLAEIAKKYDVHPYGLELFTDRDTPYSPYTVA